LHTKNETKEKDNNRMAFIIGIPIDDAPDLHSETQLCGKLKRQWPDESTCHDVIGIQ
jgi:hypothetical protein